MNGENEEEEVYKYSLTLGGQECKQQLVRDINHAVATVLEKAQELDHDVNGCGLDIDDARLFYASLKEALDEVDKVFKQYETFDDDD